MIGVVGGLDGEVWRQTSPDTLTMGNGTYDLDTFFGGAINSSYVKSPIFRLTVRDPRNNRDQIVYMPMTSGYAIGLFAGAYEFVNNQGFYICGVHFQHVGETMVVSFKVASTAEPWRGDSSFVIVKIERRNQQ